MAKQFRAPTEIPLPEYDIRLSNEENDKRETDYLNKLKALSLSRYNLPNVVKPKRIDLIGEIIRFPRADGYARYLVWNVSPLQLIWLELGDAWQVEGALIRGLNLQDVIQKVEGERAFARMFEKARTAEKTA